MTNNIFPLPHNRVYIVAEAEINHNGDLETALRMVDAASDTGADGLKLQYILASEIATPEHPQYAMFKKVELAHDEYIKIFRYAEERGLNCFITTPSVRTLELSLTCRPKFIKIGSSNLTNLPLLKAVNRTGIPVILSTGMATLGEIESALNCLENTPVALLHCTVKYPAAANDLNLNAIRTIQVAFPGRIVGYSDHTESEWAAVIAVTLGARIIEKHFTLDRNQEGPDHRFSTDPEGFKRLVSAVRFVESALGHGRKVPCPEEEALVNSIRRYLVATENIKKDQALSEQNLDCRRVNFIQGNIGAQWLSQVSGWRAPKSYSVGDVLNWEDFKA